MAEATSPQPCPRWANDWVGLPVQQQSDVGLAAHALQHQPTTVPVPLGLDRMPVPKETYRLANQPQTRLVQDAHAACNRLTIVCSATDTQRLLRAEAVEIEAATREKAPPDDTLAPRHTSVTALVNPAKTSNAPALLDAMAHLARAPSAAAGAPCAATKTRIAFLAGTSARAYAAAHANQAVATKSTTVKGNTELCLTWAEELVPPAGDAEGGWQLRSEFVEIPFCTDADEYARTIANLIHELWSRYDLRVGQSRLLDPYGDNEPAAGAYVRGMVDCADNFWAPLHVYAQCELSRFAHKSSSYQGLEFSRQFLKLVPRPKTQGEAETPPNHPSVYHGLLLHQAGKSAESKKFCESIKREEAARMANEGKRLGVFGLRAPQSSAEEAVCPHVLVATAHSMAFGTKLSAFGLLAVAGEPLSVDGSRMPYLKYKIVPVDARLLERAFVLPCLQNACDPTQIVLRKPMWLLLQEALREYADVFGDQTHVDPVVEKRHARREQVLVKPSRKPTAEEAQIGVMLGLPLGCAAFRVGEVRNALAASKGASSLHRFLMAAVAKFGSEESVRAVFDSTTALMVDGKRVAEAQTRELETLKRKLEEAELRVEALETLRDKKTKSDAVVIVKEAKPTKADAEAKIQSVADAVLEIEAAAPAPDREEHNDPEQFHPKTWQNDVEQLHHVEHVLGWTFGMAHDPEDHFVLRGTFKRYDVRNVCRKLEDAHSTESNFLEKTTQSWAIGEFKGTPPTSTIAALAKILAHGMVHLRNQFDFEEGKEWQNPVLLVVDQEQKVVMHVIDDAGTTSEALGSDIVDVDMELTAVAFFFEATNAFCFAKKVEEEEDDAEEAALSD